MPTNIRKKMVYVDDEVHKKLNDEAAELGTTVNNVIRDKYGLDRVSVVRGPRPKEV